MLSQIIISHSITGKMTFIYLGFGSINQNTRRHQKSRW